MTYYYVLNLQGDVIKLIEADGTVVAEYTYNAWGEILTSSGTMSEINPLRYRGYYYDSETGFYYLQSRYYDPAMHRFINADAYASTGTGVLGYNMFAYCNNEPVRFTDGSGKAPYTIRGLDLPEGEGIPVEICGETYYYYTRQSSQGDLYEYWYDSDGNLIWVRHNSTHGNSNHHNNPHDHSGKKDANGENTEGKEALPVNPNFYRPNENNQGTERDENTSEMIGTVILVGVVFYEVVKWSLAFLLAAPTGGTSLGGAAVLP